MRIDTWMLCSTSSSPRQSVAAADAHLARRSAHSSAEGLGGSSTSSMTWITVCDSSSSSMAGRKSPTNAWGSMCFPAYRVAACGHQQASNFRQSRQMPRVAVACSLESFMRGALVTSWQFRTGGQHLSGCSPQIESKRGQANCTQSLRPSQAHLACLDVSSHHLACVAGTCNGGALHPGGSSSSSRANTTPRNAMSSFCHSCAQQTPRETAASLSKVLRMQMGCRTAPTLELGSCCAWSQPHVAGILHLAI